MNLYLHSKVQYLGKQENMKGLFNKINLQRKLSYRLREIGQFFVQILLQTKFQIIRKTYIFIFWNTSLSEHSIYMNIMPSKHPGYQTTVLLPLLDLQISSFKAMIIIFELLGEILQFLFICWNTSFWIRKTVILTFCNVCHIWNNIK